MAASAQSTRLTVMISSTARDLPEHRKEVQEACLRQGMFPLIKRGTQCTDFGVDTLGEMVA